MAYIDWVEDYSVGIESINSQHKKLFDIINKLHNAMKQGKSKDIIVELIKELKNYTVYHFKLEEENMVKTKYSGYLIHKKEHDTFTNKIIEFQNSYNLQSSIASIELMHYLKEWLIRHVLGTDKKYSPHFVKNKIV